MRAAAACLGCCLACADPTALPDAGDDLWYCPNVLVSSTSLTWTMSPLDEPDVRALNVENGCDGGDDLQVRMSMAGQTHAFTTETSAMLVAPGGSEALQLWYTADSYDPTHAELTLTTNAYGNVAIDVTLSGTANPDQDGDGFDAIEAGGDDCDDLDPERTDDC